MLNRLIEWMGTLSWMPEALVRPVAVTGLTCGIFLLSFLLYWLGYKYLQRLINHWVRRTGNRWDDAFMEAGVFRRILRLLPVFFAYVGVERLLVSSGSGIILSRILYALIILSVGRAIQALLDSVNRVYQMVDIQNRRPIKGYLQAMTIVLYVFVTIFAIATLLDKSPWGLFTMLGGLTAVLLLIFKDTILGFVAGIQLSAHDMVRVGDWIEMPKYGADGDVTEVTVNTVKVQNWDKTISTIPTYAMISDSFKNWRGMSDSGGRRIKRSVFLDMNSIRFVDDAMLARFREIDILSAYVEGKQKEIDANNQRDTMNLNRQVNGRRQTNVGIFRAYLKQFLSNHPMIHDEMTFLVRQLQPTAQGLPIEIYVFSRDQVWANYEAIQADIFDHLLAAIPEFSLRVFQSPSGADVQTLTGKQGPIAL